MKPVRDSVSLAEREEINVTALNFRIVQQPQTKPEGQTTEDRLRDQVAHQERELGRLRQAALRDPITGGANMRCIAMAYDWIEQDDPVSMLFIDVDGFRKVNDALGRECGDSVLTAIHNEIERCLRWDDVAAREGSDRFIALLPLAIAQDAHAVGERVREAIERMVFQSSQGRFRLTVRVGCTTRNGSDTLSDLISRSDLAARGGARAGGNVVVAS